jgi:hypothetical protein
MLNNDRLAFVTPSLFGLLSLVSVSIVGLGGCAHTQAVSLTSAATVAPTSTTPALVAAAPAPAPAPASSGGAPSEELAEADEDSEAEEAKPAAKRPEGPMTFEELSAALGDGDKIALDVNGGETTTAPTGKGLSADGYAAVTAAHQAVDTGSGARAAGDIKVSGGLTTTAVRAGVRDAGARLRACYQHGLVANPRLAGRVTVTFTVDARGGVSGVETESDVIPADVRACVADAFSSITFAMPKTAPAKIVYPVDFNKDS